MLSKGEQDLAASSQFGWRGDCTAGSKELARFVRALVNKLHVDQDAAVSNLGTQKLVSPMNLRPADPTASNPPCAVSIGQFPQIQVASSQGFSVMLGCEFSIALFCILSSFSLHSCVICPSHSLPFFPPDAVPQNS